MACFHLGIADTCFFFSTEPQSNANAIANHKSQTSLDAKWKKKKNYGFLGVITLAS